MSLQLREHSILKKMELCSSQAMSKLPCYHHHGNNNKLLISNPNNLHCKPSLIPLRRTSLLCPAVVCGLHSRLFYSPKCLPRATSEETFSGANQYISEATSEETSSGANQYTSEATSEETSSGANEYTSERRDSVITSEDVPPVEKKADNDYLTIEVTQEKTEESPLDEGQSLISEFLDKLNEAFINLTVRQNLLSQIDSEDAYSILLYGGGTTVVLWLASAIVGAIDSVPLFPKLLEIVGLGYTTWFTYRYLIFKKSREELVATLDKLKEEILGSNDDG